jgi:hypothetical protein
METVNYDRNKFYDTGPRSPHKSITKLIKLASDGHSFLVALNVCDKEKSFEALAPEPPG